MLLSFLSVSRCSSRVLLFGSLGSFGAVCPKSEQKLNLGLLRFAFVSRWKAGPRVFDG